MYVMFSFSPHPQGGGAFPVASPTMHGICGVAPEEVRYDIGPFFDRIEPEDRAALQQAIAVATRDQTAWDMEFRYRHPDKGPLWMRAHCTPLIGEDGRLQWYGFINDITQRKRDLRELDERNIELRRFAFLVNHSQAFIGMCDLALRPFFVNQAGLKMVGLERMEEACAVAVEEYFFPEDRPMITERFLPRVLEDGHATIEIRFRHFKTGEPIWMSYSVLTLRDEHDQPLGYATISQNIDARKQDEAQMRILVDELNHRVRNTLAIVNSIATQTLKHTARLPEFGTAFSGRIAALAETHTLLASTNWGPSTLDLVISKQLDPYTNGRADALAISGPRLLISPKQALTLSLVFHELAANSVKHGALSAPAGHIEICWKIDSEHRVQLTWQESGGPHVGPPARRGFGSELIEFSIAHEFGGNAALDYRPQGMSCLLTIPLRREADEI